MKKIIFVLAMFLFTTLVYSQKQIAIGYTMSELESTFGPEGWNKGTTDGGDLYLYKSFSNGVWYYSLWDGNNCNKICFVDPQSLTQAQGFIEHMNKNWVIVDESNWKLYYKGSIIYAALFWPEGGIYPQVIYW